MEEKKVGIVIKYFSKPEVAAIHLTEGELKVGDRIRIKGHTTDFEQTVESMQISNSFVEVAETGSDVGIKSQERVREHDEVFCITG